MTTIKTLAYDHFSHFYLCTSCTSVFFFVPLVGNLLRIGSLISVTGFVRLFQIQITTITTHTINCILSFAHSDDKAVSACL